MSRLPLNGLRVFEACARHGSFLRAAEQLAITPGAVSRQIKALEAELGVRLFERFNRAVRLTDAGARLMVGVSDGLARLEEAVSRIRPAADGPLVVSVLHSMAVKWLAPRLSLFEQRHPEISVLVAASDRAVDLGRGEADVAIRMGTGPYPGLDAQLLSRPQVYPVCSPGLAAQADLKRPEDLSRTVLIHDVQLLPGEPNWSDWLGAAGVEGVDTERGLRFSNTYLALDAAIAGRGVALAFDPVADDDLAAGRLIRPFAFSMPNPYSHWAICLPERADHPKIRRFRKWLGEQAGAVQLI
jgi:LysR family transcriptional regulator, glycine cleavage system transcriptional activator